MQKSLEILLADITDSDCDDVHEQTAFDTPNGLDLESVLTAWDNGTSQDSPSKLLYLLDHTYPSDSKRSRILKAPDLRKLDSLRSEAERLGMHLGLADIFYFKHQPLYDDDDDRIVTEMSVDKLVDLEGKLVTNSLTIDDECETIPTDWEGVIEQGPFDDEEVENIGDECVRSLLDPYAIQY